MLSPIDSPHPTPESGQVNPLECPIGYFDAQVRFAQKWSEISGEDFAGVLLSKTSLYRRVIGSPNSEDVGHEQWDELLAGVDYTTDADSVTKRIYEAYANNPESSYYAPKSPSALGYDFNPDTQTVKIHFSNPHRGVSPLSDINMAKRREDFKALLEDVRVNHPEAALLMSATWLRSTRHYRSLSPPDISEPRNLMSPNMKLTGNSVWGQFIDASGNTNQRVYEQFIDSVQAATTIDQLIEAFPYKTLLAVDPIDQYYSYYGVEDTEGSIKN